MNSNDKNRLVNDIRNLPADAPTEQVHYDRRTVERIPSLVPESITGEELTPVTQVLCIHRGDGEAQPFKYDGVDYKIPRGKFYAEYRMAKLLQARLVVPGTRNREDMTQQSFIGIISVATNPDHFIDAPELCVPFTDEEMASFGEKREALDRSDEIVTYKDMKHAHGGLKSAAPIAAFVGNQPVPVSDVLQPSDEPNAAAVDTGQAFAEGALEPQGGAEHHVKGRKGGSMSDVKNKIRRGE